MTSKKNIWYYIKNYGSNSLFIKNLLITFLLIILPLSIICGVVYESSTAIIEDGAKDMNTGSVYRIKDVLDTIIRETRLLAAHIVLNQETETFMLSDMYKAETEGISGKLIDEIKSYSSIYRYVHSIYIYSGKKDYMISNVYVGSLTESPDKNWINIYDEASADNVYVRARISDNGYPYFISIVIPYFFYKTDKMGAVIVNINMEEIDKIIGNTGNAVSQNTFIIDKDGTIIYSHDKNLLLTRSNNSALLSGINGRQDGYSTIRSQNGKKYIVSVVNSLDQDWKYVAAFPLRYYDQRLNKMKTFIIYFIVLTAITGIILSFLLSIRAFQPVKNIISLLENPGEWNSDSRTVPQKSSNELDYIKGTFLQTVQANHEMEMELKKRMTLLNNAQASALQAQINPHFLCNTLDTIRWSAMELTGTKNEVSSMITDLSHLFSLALDMENRLVPISTEIEHAQLYIKIMALRHINMFKVAWDIAPSILNNKIVKLSFQPLIENAIYHGVKPKKTDGIITIKGWEENDNVHIQFIDNGVGMTPENCKELNRRMNNKSAMLGDHIGMRNVNQRIKLIFGNQYGISVMSNNNEGTTVEIFIPKV